MIVVTGLQPAWRGAVLRGYMQTRLVERLGAAWAIIITAFCSLIHSISPTAYMPGNGLMLGWVAWSFGSIRPAIMCHC